MAWDSQDSCLAHVTACNWHVAVPGSDSKLLLLPASACSEQQEEEHGVHTSALKEPHVLEFLFIFLLGGTVTSSPFNSWEA